MSEVHFVSPNDDGFTRHAQKTGFKFYDTHGALITDDAVVERLKKIGLPPAYQQAWFCPDPNGHIQAVGVDARGRRQYRYHVDYRSAKDSIKFERAADFGRRLPKLRARVERDIGGNPLDRQTMLAAVVRLLDTSAIRVGNDAYARANKSYGATTLLHRHLKMTTRRALIEFRGKSGKDHRVQLTDKALLRIVRECQDLPGQHLFQYRDGAGALHVVTSSDVNNYLRNALGNDFSAKDFRTWSASGFAIEYLSAAINIGGPVKMSAMLEAVANRLGNTPAIARKSYIHPRVLELVNAGDFAGLKRKERPTKWLSAFERKFLKLIS